ncbi:MAG: hypothetical protein SPL42_05775 [Bacteroidales bacterium]|nr:hypothetical protein [Bacteroidales bacterium]MDY6347922.1 hypothetical protein [Bacteroidales bacterium]
MFKVPVLLILYNRIEEAHDVFQVLRTVQPTQLYVAGDAPVKGDVLDTMHCYQTRAVIQPEWPCQVHKLWQENHLGKTQMILESINWFFEHEDEGIILFEDTLPGYDFFPYCEELLERYRNNKKVFSIGGSYLRHRSRKRYRKRMKKGQSSYFFSAYASTWGFATWKNRWADFTLSLDNYTKESFEQMASPYLRGNKQKIYWMNRLNLIKKQKKPYWFYQYIFHIWAHQGLCINPYLNLVTNLGIKETEPRKLRRLRRNAYPIMPLIHPDNVEQDYDEDRYMFKHLFKRAYLTLFKEWLKLSGNKQNE